MNTETPSMLTPVVASQPILALKTPEIGSVARIKVSGKEFDWRKPYEKGESYTAYGSASLIALPAELQNKQTNTDFYLLTAFHVVENTELIWSTFPSVSGQQLKTIIVGCCPAIDIAILKITERVPDNVAQQLRRFTLGDSDALQVRQRVEAGGYPLHQEALTIVEGVLSGLQEGMLQTTAPTNRGNSGGPLFDPANGKIIGVIVSSEDDTQGMHYAVPTRQILIHLDAMLHEYTRLPSFNFSTNRTTKDLLKTLGCPPKMIGAFVRYVEPNTPLHTAGMRSGDVLTGFLVNEYKPKYLVDLDNNVKVPWWPSPVTIENIEQRLRLDETIVVEFWSVAQQALRSERVTLSAPDASKIRKYYRQFEPVEYEAFGGVVVMELTRNHIMADSKNDYWQDMFTFLLRQEPERLAEPLLVITDVLANSSVRALLDETIGIADVVTHVNGQPVKSLKEYRKALHVHKDGYIVWQTRDGMKSAIEYLAAQKEHERFIAEYAEIKIKNV